MVIQVVKQYSQSGYAECEEVYMDMKKVCADTYPNYGEICIGCGVLRYEGDGL
jgi:hypothetical protein